MPLRVYHTGKFNAMFPPKNLARKGLSMICVLCMQWLHCKQYPAVFDLNIRNPRVYTINNIDGLVQVCSISSVLAMEILQFCTKPLISDCYNGMALILIKSINSLSLVSGIVIYSCLPPPIQKIYTENNVLTGVANCFCTSENVILVFISQVAMQRMK